MAKQKKVKPGDGTWGQGSVRQRGSTWQVRWREGDERRSSSGHLSRAEAVEELEKIQARLSLGQPGVALKLASVKPSAPRSIPKLVEEWLEHRRAHGIRTVDEDSARWALHLAAPLATQTLETISAKWIRDLAQELVRPTTGSKAPDGTRKQPISGPTAHRVLTLLSGFLSWSADEGHVGQNAARTALRSKDVKRLLRSTYDKDDRPYLKTWGEVDALYAALVEQDPTVAIYFVLGARAGLRPGECLALTWGDVRLDARTIHVDKQVRSGQLGPTKSGKPRSVPIGETLAQVLGAWRVARGNPGDDALVCPPPVRVRKSGKPGASWGTYLGPKSIEPAWSAALVATGFGEASVYDFGRRSYGSIMGLSSDWSVWRLQQAMGHANVETTARYVSLRDQALAPTELRALG